MPEDLRPPAIPAATTRPQTHRRGKRTEPMDPAIRAVIRAARNHRRRYEPDRAEAEAMAKAYRATLIPRKKSGIDANPGTTKGAKIYVQAMDEFCRQRPGTTWERYRDSTVWPDIYRATIPGFGEMDLADRQYYSTRMRNNVKGLLRRRGVKLSPGKRSRRRSSPTN